MQNTFLLTCFMVVRCCGEYFKMTAMPFQLVSSALPLRYSRLSLDKGKEQRQLAESCVDKTSERQVYNNNNNGTQIKM